MPRPSDKTILNNPPVGLVAKPGGDRPSREIVERFLDAAGNAHVHYTITRCISLREWQNWVSRTGAVAEIKHLQLYQLFDSRSQQWVKVVDASGFSHGSQEEATVFSLEEALKIVETLKRLYYIVRV